MICEAEGSPVPKNAHPNPTRPNPSPLPRVRHASAVECKTCALDVLQAVLAPSTAAEGHRGRSWVSVHVLSAVGIELAARLLGGSAKREHQRRLQAATRSDQADAVPGNDAIRCYTCSCLGQDKIIVQTGLFKGPAVGRPGLKFSSCV